MKKYIPKVLIIVFSMIVITACKDLTELNDNPNAVEPDHADPNILVTTVISNTSTMYLESFGYDKFAGVMQHCQKDAWYSDFNDFDWSSSSWGGIFEILRTNELLINISSENDEFYSFHHGVGLVMKAFLFGLITDMWGDVPYTEALQGNGEYMTPKYDSQKDVYISIINDLKESLHYFVKSAALEANSDILYYGNMEKWKKFANSLMLRYYMRVSNKMPNYAREGFAEVVNSGNIFTSMDDDAAIEYLGNNMQDSWPFNLVYDDTQGSNYRRIKACDTFVKTLKGFNDPRIKFWFNKIEVQTKLSDTVTVNGAIYKIDGKQVRVYHPDSTQYTAYVDTASDYVGIPPNLLTPEAYNLNNAPPQSSYNKFVSFLNDQFKEPKGEFLKARMLTYSEVSFLLAEAALKGWISGESVETYYYNGIRASINMWGEAEESDIDDWMANQEGVTWGTGTWDEPLEQLIEQKWIASWTYQTESWLDCLRTGYPKLSFGPGARQPHLPYRYMYGSDDISYNNENYNEAVDKLEMTQYSQGHKDNTWSKTWLYQEGVDEP